MSALLAALAGANCIYGAGMLELGITFSFEQFVMDNDIAKMVKRIVRGIDVNDETLAVDVIKNVGCAGHFLAQEHTLNHMKKTQSQPELMNRKMRHGWKEQGSKSLTEVAKEKSRDILNNYKPEPLSSDIKDKLTSIIKETEKELGI